MELTSFRFISGPARNKFVLHFRIKSFYHFSSCYQVHTQGIDILLVLPDVGTSNSKTFRSPTQNKAHQRKSLELFRSSFRFVKYQLHLNRLSHQSAYVETRKYLCINKINKNGYINQYRL